MKDSAIIIFLMVLLAGSLVFLKKRNNQMKEICRCWASDIMDMRPIKSSTWKQDGNHLQGSFELEIPKKSMENWSRLCPKN